MSGVRQPGARWSVTDVGSNAGVTITKAAATGVRHVITDFDAESDKASLVQIKDGDTVVWQTNLGESGGRVDRSLQTPIYGSVGNAVSLSVSDSTNACSANMSGVTVRN